MTSPAPILQLPSRLAQLESQALEHKEAALSHWQSFVTAVLEIQSKQLWPSEQYADFNAYCKARFGVGASRIRQYKSALPYAEILQEIGLDSTEKQIRDCRAATGKDDNAFIPVMKAALELTPNPQARHFAAIYEAMQNQANTGASNVGGLSMPRSSQANEAEYQEAIQEANNRYKQHIADNAKIKQRWVGSAKEAILLLSSKFQADKAIVILYEDDTE